MLDMLDCPRVKPHNDWRRFLKVGFFRSLLILLGVFFSCLALLIPFLALDVPLTGEVWILESITELHRNFRLVPTLNGVSLSGPNPLMPVLFSLLPLTDVAALRLVNILFGCLAALAVFFFCTSQWGARSGIASALITMTSWGFIASHATLNLTAVPAALAVISFLLFAQVYLKGQGARWYLPSYFLTGTATVLGGWIPLGFFVFGAILLILFDLSPRRILSILAPYGILLIAVMVMAVLLVYSIAAGWSYAAGVFSFDTEHGVFERLWIWIKYLLPWLLLVFPAWAYSGRPQGPGAWRALLAPKTGFGMGLAVVLFSPNFQGGYALLGVPFAGILIGYWVAGGFLVPQRLRIVRAAALAATGTILVVWAFFWLSVESIRDLSLNLTQGLALLALLAATGLFWCFARKQQAPAVIGVCMVLVFCLSWYAALVMLPARSAGPVSYARQIGDFSPLLVYRDDLAMRGYLGYAGARPIVVSEEVVPIGQAAYLALRTNDLDKAVDLLSRRMDAEVINTYNRHETYALVRISPFFRE